MNKMVIGVSALLGLIASPALAADLPVRAPPPLPSPCVWCGWYVGGNAGWIDRDGDLVAGTPIANDGTNGAASGAALVAAAATGSLNRGQGFIGGVQVGYNRQFANWVWGFEADIDGTSLRGDTNISAVTPNPGFPVNVLNSSINATQGMDYFGTFRGRIGWVPVAPLMIYGTAGLAYGRPTASVTIFEQFAPGAGSSVINPASVTINSSSTRAGWTIGGGLEWMFLPHWSVKFEGLYYDLGNQSTNGVLIIHNSAGAGSNFETTGVLYRNSFLGAIARAGVNFHF
jgi:outer membrane immunogenic protein